ncbi:hypothetical protein TPL01_26460 [Sulfuriferula plumbiphila]|uniref:HEAT repeat domain-containing protein n=1 Tax=Sulfuriferula plumbiphila TaxID=171865 RepID=A0A512LAK9_9PROT|nr:hypothetical protein SFPGR_23470 [Sulfuriferula plumbiphila]GEP31508.1 hypothetical protein TPL01_26460 [Sulfuriferula plumbiphila]
MEGLQQICLRCFHLIPAETQTCPHCGADLAAFAARDYADKLIAALGHSLSEVRMRAIIALGWRGEGRAAQPLLELALRHPVDVVEGLAVVKSLAGMGVEGRIALVALAERHQAHAVRETAQQVLRTIRHAKH